MRGKKLKYLVFFGVSLSIVYLLLRRKKNCTQSDINKNLSKAERLTFLKKKRKNCLSKLRLVVEGY